MRAIILSLFLVVSIITIYGQNLNYTLPDPGNKNVNLVELKGENLTIIDFWATWCKPCVTAMPKINMLYEKYKTQGVNVIGVSMDGTRSRAKISPLVSSLSVTYPIVIDFNNDLSNAFGVSVLPTLIILDKNGKKVFEHEGFSPGDETLIEKAILKYL
jgi:cytochrome c biogenesis protein CcmG, thiol:disulfide interchange protein DsbE